MSPLEGSLLLMVLALALVGVGYWLGRTWPAPQPKHAPPRTTQPALSRAHLPRASGGPHVFGAPRVSDGGSALPRTAAARPAVQPEARTRLEQEIEERVQALRRAREHAEPWRPPAVDCEAASPYAVWFADTAVEPYTPPKTR